MAGRSEGGRVAPERPRAGRWVEGGRHAIGQAARGRSRGQRAALEGRAQTCWTWTWTWTWVGEFWWSEMRSAQSELRCAVGSISIDKHAPRQASEGS